MYRLLSAFLPFIKELFFERKEEMDFSSYKFNIKKWIQYVLFLGLIVISIFMGNRLVTLSSKVIDMRKSYHKLEEVEKKDVEMIKSLQDRMNELQEQNKQLQLQCLIGKDALHTGNKTLKNSVTVKKPELIK